MSVPVFTGARMRACLICWGSWCYAVALSIRGCNLCRQVPRIGSYVRVQSVEGDWFGIFMGMAEDTRFGDSHEAVEAFNIAYLAEVRTDCGDRRFRLEDEDGSTQVIPLGSIEEHGYLFIADGANPRAPYKLATPAERLAACEEDVDEAVGLGQASSVAPAVPVDVTDVLLPCVDLEVIDSSGVPEPVAIRLRCPRCAMHCALAWVVLLACMSLPA